MRELRPIKGLTFLVVMGPPLPSWRPQFTLGKPWLHFRFAWRRFAVALIPLDLENVLDNYARLTYRPTPEQPDE